MIDFFVIINKQGKLRMSRWYADVTLAERSALVQRLTKAVLERRGDKAPAFLDLPGGLHAVARRYASLHFIVGSLGSARSQPGAGSFLWLDIVHRYVETLDGYFGNVCELDLVFNFAKAMAIWDAMCVGGTVVDLSTRHILRDVAAFDERVLQDNKR